MCFSISDPSSHPIFGYNVKGVLSVVYKKINGSVNYRSWHASCHTITIHTWFCDFIGSKYRSQSCANTRTVFRPKKKRWGILDFYHKLFPEHEWYLSLLTAVAYMSVTTFICDDYTTCLKIIKLINCITHVMIILGPCRNNDFFLSNKFQAGMAKFALFLCAHVVHTNANWHSSLKNEIINLTDVGKDGSATEFSGDVGHRYQIHI